MTQQHWHATVEYDGIISTNQAETLVHRGGDNFVVATIDGERGRTRIAFAVEASTLRQAADAALRTARGLAEGIVTGPAVQVRVITEADLAEEAERPPVPELVDTADARAILGVRTQQRMAEIEARDDFPAPVATLSGGRRVYTRAAIEAFGKRWARKPGRPRKVG